jgi:cytochrome c biogenesis protein CcmG, thiol:disulfide interchange protein DsbE
MSAIKKIFLFHSLFLLASFLSAQAQVPLDSIQLKTLKGPMISYGDLARKNPVILVCFWSVNSDPSINELNAINKQYEKWKQLASFKLMAVCVDQGNLLNRMRPTFNMNGWTFDVYADINGDLQRALSFNAPPQSMLLQNGKVVYQQSGFQAGTEDYLFSQVKSLSPAKK